MHRVAVLAVNHVASFDLGIAVQVFGTAFSLDKPAEQLIGPRLYEVLVCAAPGAVTVDAPAGRPAYQFATSYSLAAALDADTVFVLGMAPERPPAAIVETVREAHRRGARVASICTGAFILAEAGLLDGLRATTHWTWTEQLRRQYPQVEIVPDVLYVDNGRVWTSAGSAAGLDMCLAMIRADFGAAVAAEAARHLLVAPQRAGGQAQFIVHESPVAGSGTLEPTMQWMRENLDRPLQLTEIARHAAMSSRTLQRRFAAQTGTTPLQWLIRQRLQRAQELLETTDLSMEAVADRSGFGTGIVLRQHFCKYLHTAPLAYRKTFQST